MKTGLDSALFREEREYYGLGGEAVNELAGLPKLIAEL